MRNITILVLLALVIFSCKKETVGPKHDPNENIINTIYGKTDSAGIDSIYGYALYIPSAFTPNGDGLNESWGVKGFGVNTFELYIYDRWGKQMFNTNDMNNLWNGYRNNDKTGNIEPLGVYECEIKVQDVTGENHHYIEQITLLI